MFSFKCFTVFCILVSLNEARHGGGGGGGGGRGEGGHHGLNGNTNLVSTLCSGATNVGTCRQTAMSCFFRLPNDRSAFCFCVKNVTGASSLYTTWVQNQQQGRDMCSENSRGNSGRHFFVHTGGRSNPFVNYVAGQDATLASNLQCCIGQNQGLYLSTGSANLTAWHQQASSITNATVLAAVNAQIDSCGSSVTACNATALFECVVQGCYNAIKV